jgi:3-phosphoglycerate kinase
MKTITEKQRKAYLVETIENLKELNTKIVLLTFMGETDCDEFKLFITQREQLKKIKNFLVVSN